jgi:hypothetical protein
MPNYDRQLIVLFLTGGPGDQAIIDNSKGLQAKAKEEGIPSHEVKFLGLSTSTGIIGAVKDWSGKKNIKHEMGKLTGQSRVYLQGHGGWQSQKLGGWGPEWVAAGLVGTGMPAVKLISILGCNLGRDLGANGARVANSANSFASIFHKSLKEDHNMEIDVYARTYSLTVLPKSFGTNKGKKETVDDTDTWLGGRTHSKLLFRWEGGVQKRYWIDYGNNSDRPGV